MTGTALAQPRAITPHEQRLLAQLQSYRDVQSLPQIWGRAASQFGAAPALIAPHADPPVTISYQELAIQIEAFAGGLLALGLPAATATDLPPRLALFADNSPRWLIADQGTLRAGAANAVRGAQADIPELLYILEDSGAIGLIVEDAALLHKLQPGLEEQSLQFVIVLSDEVVDLGGLRVVSFSEVLELGRSQTVPEPILQLDRLATLIYTSGTTGQPKGVMLSHGNLLHQVTTLGVVVQPQPGDTVLSILPTWHSYERACEYFLLSQGCTQVYTTLRHVKQDLRHYRPQFMVSVPRLWESIYEGVQKQFREQPPKKRRLIDTFFAISQRFVLARRRWQGLDLLALDLSPLQRLTEGAWMLALAPLHRLGDRLVYGKVREATGGRIRQVISGGGSLALHLDTFFEIVGVDLLVGYGLTETSPVLTGRRPWHNLRGSAGQPIPGTAIRIVDPETQENRPSGDRGLVLAKGPQIMQGYFGKPEATAQVLDAEGWFNTGDLGYVVGEGNLVLTGRAKDTIVLTNGENIEPQPIEDACLRSSYISQIMLVGQDRKSLGALIVPNQEAIALWAAEQSISQTDLQGAVQKLIREELNREVRDRPGYRIDDRIGPFRLLEEPFSMENGLLTQTLKIRRNVVAERYAAMIDGMFESAS
ncbi:AMP-dependent synthetase/ligase [Synechococcus elongatus]|uniref:AMP-dependent synthetase/ligase n=1 Tax=Synechococcus elongatus TaxID=32046 RepID=UPI0030CD0058